MTGPARDAGPQGSTAAEARAAILAFDTATSDVVVAAGAETPLAVHRWPAGYRHGEQLLPSVTRVLAELGLERSALGGVVVGTGPGAFTGLRVGLATAKALAHGLAIPLVGVATSDALLAAAARLEEVPLRTLVLLLPAGPTDRVVCRPGARPRRLVGGEEPDLASGERLVAVDLDGRAPSEAVAAGGRAHAAFAEDLLALGASRLRRGDADDVERLVPEYVTLPRGVAAASGEVAWSRDPR